MTRSRWVGSPTGRSSIGPASTHLSSRLATNEVTVYSPICTHLGCGYRWDAGEKEFKCPCHGSVFDLNGKVVGGPAPRSLDRLPVKIENGHLLVQYKEFKSGTKQQIEI